MFRVEHNVPDVYVQESRDFQLFSRLYDLVFQSSRFSVDSMEQVADTMRCNERLLSLVATKVGFFTDLRLTDNTYRKILSAFPYIIKYKGSLRGIRLVANLFERIMNTVVTVDNSQEKITIVFENNTPNIQLLYSLMEYIRPTGLFVDYAVRSKTSYVSDYMVEDNVDIRTLKIIDYKDDINSGFVSSSVVAQDLKDTEFVRTLNWDITSNVGFAQISQTEPLKTEESVNDK